MERSRSELPVTIDTDFSTLSRDHSTETYTEDLPNPTDPTVAIQELLPPIETKDILKQTDSFLDFQYKKVVAESQRRLAFCQKKYTEVLNSITTVHTNAMKMPAETRTQLLTDLPLVRDYWEQQIILVAFPAQIEAEHQNTNTKVSETTKEQVAKFHFPIDELSLPLKKLILLNQMWRSQMVKINHEITLLQNKKDTPRYFEIQHSREELLYKIQEITEEIQRRTRGDDEREKVTKFINEVTATMPITVEHSFDTQIETQMISLAATQNYLKFLQQQKQSPETIAEIASLQEYIHTTQQRITDLQQKRNTTQYQKNTPTADLEAYTQISTDNTSVFTIPRSKPISKPESRIKRGIKKISGIFFRRAA